MNELNSYFARHPLENPANYLGTEFDPAGAAAYRLRLRSWKERYRARLRAAQRAQKPSGAVSQRQRQGPMQPPPAAHCRYSFNLL
ncbi:hypothetical protein M2165_004884 [Variovorax sp. TBS-050B]|uniref:hypothetical protein n=1 Tax=Variovorax sp. TBS-050B TaxID=2940551 RepID=UPI002476B983|nr:hypothetical protein [Variovorax sp. TBS-050B]MDH6594995.1 hypothetical protein [Variovorax sp. TBS-050B]